MMPEEGYGTWFHGKVVDMFYFPIYSGSWPSWMPIIGGQDFRFFNAIFNIADFAISVGVGILIVFNKRAFNPEKPQAHVTYSDNVEPDEFPR
jgi:signal peptidase II